MVENVFTRGEFGLPVFIVSTPLKKCETVEENSMHSRRLVSPHWLCNALSVSIP
jgi:hypothetical protein